MITMYSRLGRSDAVRGPPHRSRRGPTRCHLLVVAYLPLFAAFTACGNLTAGGVAEGEAIVTGDGSPGATPAAPTAHALAPSDEGAARAAPEGRAGPSGQGPIGPPFGGTVQMGLSVLLLRPGGEPLEISGGHREVAVDIQGEGPVSLGPIAIPPGEYAGVRVVFTHVEATVTGGLDLLPPVTSVTVTVDFGGEPTLVVEGGVPVTVEDGGRLVATVDLQASTWIQTVALATVRVVPASVFRSLVQISLDAP